MMTKPTVLVIDDEADILDLLYRTLHREFQVLRANNGPEALDILAKDPNVAVIISDQRMPLMSGTEFLSLTAEQYPDVMRIIVTGYTDVDDLVEAINSGKVFKYVTKPWDDEDLKASVRKAVETHNVLRSRTWELRQALRRESLLNEVSTTVRSVMDSRTMLQTIVEAVGQALQSNCCLLRPVEDGHLTNEQFVHWSSDPTAVTQQSIETIFESLRETVWLVESATSVDDAATDQRLQTSEPVWQGRQSAFERLGIRSSAIVPMVYRGEAMAVMALHRCETVQPWSEEDLQLAVAVADQAALALAQARAYDRVRALADQEALVNAIATAIRSSLEPKTIFATITQQLRQALKSDGCALSLWTKDDEYVQCVGFDEVPPLGGNHHDWSWSPQQVDPVAAARQHEPLPRSIAPIVSNPVLQQLIDTQQPIALDDLHESSLSASLPLKQQARALLVVPLLSEGKIIGSISLRQANPRPWKRTEIKLVQAVAVQAAIAVQQSRLYQTTRQQAEQLLALDRQKTEFFQNISHEFRTPLTLMIGPLEAAVNQKQGLPYEQADVALRNSRRLLRLVNQLLDLQRVDAGRMQPTFRPCDLAEFARYILESFRPYCDRKEIALVANLTPCPDTYLDSERFDKVLYNLLSNAMKFTPRGGTITVTVEATGQHYLLQVSDTGIGIRADQIPHLFERFRQAEGSVSRGYEGTGLGLALVKELVELHGGRVTVESDYGQGATFSVWLDRGSTHLPPDRTIEQPVAIEGSRAAIELADLAAELLEHDAATRANDPLPDPEPQDLGDRPLVLVVDDNPDLRSYVSSILRRNQYGVIVARNGAEGIAAAEQYQPHLILTDLMMPGVSGLDLIRQVRQDKALQGTPIILLTAKADADTRVEGVEIGADAYLAKPFDDRELLAEVHNLIALKANERKVSELNAYLTESVLRRFLPGSLVNKAAAGELMLDLQPEPRLITVLFSDIVGFTQLSNTVRSRKVAELLNEYLSEMTHIAFANGGTIDKFMGDAILVLFGAPEEATPNEQVQRAVRTARQMSERLHQLNQVWGEQAIPPVRFRCGIHQGTAVVGMFGSAERSDYTAIGPCVNIASRIQQAARPGTVLVSAAVADYLDENDIEKVGPLELKGVDETVLTFSVNLNLED
ncbi:MAG: response regulator [Limnothrix sp.]|uniref:response regulator n=1 Tax=unclassified Limnothrix TaxID=2632864 RepID=UPI00081EFFF2|nr:MULTISPECIES: response regulator [unclassified Limnothrix]MEB3117202.1 response regulator [Limnothrix sp.]OCQ90343.1 adenylate cyclase [Limnothrix sp. P13C2]MBD2554871.1 response regulator [Limnothrix sp. FACHB-708]MBD2592078.1 response regulator [Limnothrix sp. FACHB-406]MBD2636133.1 response regulator [Limnothrix sp. FACHB-881]